MIFVTLGTDKYQFNRLLSIIDTAVLNKKITQPVFAQIGESDYKPVHFPFKEYLSFKELSNYIKDSCVVIMHAGVGSTLLSLSLGKPPILFPRQKCFGEHVDDHQLEFVQKIGQRVKCLVANNEEELLWAIREYDAFLHKETSLVSSGSHGMGIADYLIAQYPPEI